MNWWQRIVGSRDRLGWWTLPVFLLVGLTGAVLAGTLAAVYFGQQVDALEDETAAGREELRDAVTEVQDAGQEALDAIASEVDAVRESLSRELPFEDAAGAGIVTVHVWTGDPPPPPASGEGTDGAALQDQSTQQPPGDQGQATPTPAPAPSPTPTRAPRGERYGSGFAVASEGQVTFIVTTYDVVADPSGPDGISDEMEVITPEGAFPAVIHSWDASRNLALLRTEAPGIEILEWRPTAEPLNVGARVVVAGVTPSLGSVQLAGQVGYVDVTAIVTDLPDVPFLRGAPVVDDEGLVVAVYATSYAPFGAAAGRDQASIPAPLLCERMLRNCEALEAEREEASPDEG